MIISKNSNPEVAEYDHVEVKTADGGQAFFCREPGDRWCDFERPYVLTHMGVTTPRNYCLCYSAQYFVPFIIFITILCVGFCYLWLYFGEYAWFYASIGVTSPLLLYLYIPHWYKGWKRAKRYNESRMLM